jgi:histidinol dehydrogenase
VQKSPDTSSKLNKLKTYRNIAKNPEVEDAIEDAVIESTQAVDHFNIFKLKIKNEELNKNTNAVKNLQNEFNEFIYNRLKLHTKISNYFEDFYIDGELYFENVIDEKNKSRGILY